MPIEEVHAGSMRTLQRIADNIAAARKVLVVTGAGISTTCGIPDFRSRHGLYARAEADYRARQPARSDSRPLQGRELFDVSVWKSPETAAAFLRCMATLRRKTLQEVEEPSATHRFIKLLRDQRRLVRAYTQNIDGLEMRAGLKTDLAAGRGARSRFTKKALALPPSPAEKLPGGALHGGCEAVQLHGDLATLRCSNCLKTVAWAEGDQDDALIDGAAPECPACAEQDALRRLAGRRGTRVGMLRPNVVLYGEEHPAADAIGPLVTGDIASRPDLLLIFGTSLRVHGLQKIVKEFANAVHAQKNGSGKVIFINRTPPTSRLWTDVIDTWVDIDCDTFVAKMRAARPDIWTRQVSLAFPAARKAERGGKVDLDPLCDQENQPAAGMSSVDADPIQKPAPKRKFKQLAPPSTPFQNQRRGLGDFSTSSPHKPASLPSTPSKKRKRANEFEIFEEEAIVVMSSPLRRFKGVRVAEQTL